MLDVDELADVFIYRREEDAAARYLALRHEVEAEGYDVIEEDNLGFASEVDQHFVCSDGRAYYFNTHRLL